MCLCDGKGKKPGEKRVKRDKKVESTKFWEWSVPSGTAEAKSKTGMVFAGDTALCEVFSLHPTPGTWSLPLALQC